MDAYPIYERLAHQLRAQGRTLNRLRLALSCDPATLRNHSSALNEMDDIAHLLAAMSDALNSTDPEESCRSSNLAQMKILALPAYSRTTKSHDASAGHALEPGVRANSDFVPN